MSKDSNEDPRIGATAIIAGCGVGALAIIFLFGRMFGFILPVLAIAGTAYAIATVWKSGPSGNRNDSSEVEALKKKLEELEQRLADAEAVDAYEDRLATKEAKLRIMGGDGDNE